MLVGADELGGMDLFEECAAEDLTQLVTSLRPLRAAHGEELMRQGEHGDWFLLIASGAAEVKHTLDDGTELVITVSTGTIIGEKALLSGTPRMATVTVSTARLTGWTGDEETFAQMMRLPGVLSRLVQGMRQRMVEFLPPIPIQVRDGTELLLRPVLAGDAARFMHGDTEFSTETLYRRFLTPRVPPELLEYLSEVDYTDHFAWAVLNGPDEAPIAYARFDRDEHDPTLAEIALLVGDDYQHRGIGTVLLGALAVTGREDGIERFSARVLFYDRPVRNALEHYGASWDRSNPTLMTTVIDVPTDLPFGKETADGIGHVVRQLNTVI